MVVTGTLSDIEARSEAREWHGPTLIIVGEVIKLHQRLSWFHKPSLTPIT
jgi:uroporphyrin-III C-methyltransferase/precorrin-2 dehydrogenase/sirohydrochlorin ferrochelatase